MNRFVILYYDVHWLTINGGLEKMVNILRTTFSNAFSSIENFYILLQISLRFVSKGPVYNKSTVVQVIAWQATSY